MNEQDKIELGRRIARRNAEAAAEGRVPRKTREEAAALKEAEEQAEELGSIFQIQETYGQHSAGILNRLRDQYEEISKSKPETQGSYFERLTDQQKKAAIREHRLGLANKARDEAKQAYEESVREYRNQVEARKAQASAKLFGHGQELSADVLARVALANDEELRNLARIAKKTNNASLKQATLSVGEDRGMGGVLVEVFDDEDKQLYAEVKAAPPEEVLDRQAHNIDTVVPAVNESQILPAADGSS